MVSASNTNAVAITFGSMTAGDLCEIHDSKTPGSAIMSSSPHALLISSATPRPQSPTTAQSDTTSASKATRSKVFIVLQHSQSGGNSALLAMSDVLGLYTTHEAAIDALHKVRNQDRPYVKNQADMDLTKPQVNLWCSSAGEDTDECGYRYVTAGKEGASIGKLRSCFVGLEVAGVV